MGCCSSAVDQVSIQYVRELAVALRTRELPEIKRFYHRWENAMEMGPMPEDEQLEIDMHKMILEFPVLEDMHADSLAWLEERGEAWNVRGNNCSSGCDPDACGRNDPEPDSAAAPKEHSHET